ncbi:MAG: PIN domain-containing protein [Hyphomicrobiales bacterium]
MIVDTGIFIRAERMKSPAWRRQMPLGEAGAISAMTLSEMLTGLHLASDPAMAQRRGAFIEDILSYIPVVGFGTAIARVHARLRAELRRKGKTVGAHDLIIAATAVSLGWDVLTTNAAEFRQVEGLQVREA